MHKKTLFALCFLQLLSLNGFAQVQLGNTSLDTTEIYSSLNEPWEIQLGSDSNLWLTEKRGIVSTIEPLTGTKTVLLDIQNLVWQNHESGLLGMTFSPDYATDSLVYFAYTYLNGLNRYLKVVYYTHESSINSLLNEQIVVDSIIANTYHIGCRLLFMPDKTLLITTGDAGAPNYAQDKSRLAGKILRVNRDGSIPIDNPNPSSLVFSSGHRNPQGLFFYRNKIYSSEHGASTDDEVNIIELNRNYGWPSVEGYCDSPQETQFCNDSMVKEPMYTWTPTVATSDIVVYDHPAIPEWRNSILLTTLKNQSLISLQLNTNSDSVVATQTHFANYWGRLRDICIGAKGELYLITNGFTRNGNQGQHKIIKVENPYYVSLAENNKALPSYTIFPNPVKNQITLKDYPKGEFQAFVFNMEGRLVIQTTITDGEATINDLAAGVYFLKVSNQNLYFKFVKTN